MKIVTHNGRFHADDIFAVATLLHVYPNAEVVRTRDEEVIKSADIVVDVGLVYDPETKRFDHHQTEGAGKRDNDIPYASFGLVWKEFGEKVAGSEESILIDKRLVQSIDAYDNGVTISDNKYPGIREFTISDFFYSFLEKEEINEQTLLNKFLICVLLARDLLAREVKIAKKEIMDWNEVRSILDRTIDKRIVILDKDMFWHEVLIPSLDTFYVVYLGKEGNWRATAIPKDFFSFELKKPLPKSWGGKSGHELAKITGVEDALFCHRALFMCVAGSRDGAIKLAKIALNA